MKKIFLFSLLLLVFFALSCKKNEEPTVDIITTEGTITLKLYKETPQHRDNFIQLIKKGYYDNLLFHKIIPEFIIQSGDPDSKKASRNRMLGDGGPGYTLPAEIVYPKYFHKRGALCAARLDNLQNQDKRSSGSQFYLVIGTKWSPAQLDSIEKNDRERKVSEIMQKHIDANSEKINELICSKNKKQLTILQDSITAEAAREIQKTTFFTFTEEQRKMYTTKGGIPYLDKEYTVFGEVINGFEVLEKIARTETDRNERPVKDIRIIATEIK